MGAGVARRGAGPSGDITALAERLDRAPIVMCAHERHGRRAGYAVDDGQAGQGGAGAPVAARAGDLNPLSGGAPPCLHQRGQDLVPVGRKAEIGPSEPPRFPPDRRWRCAEQIDAERGEDPVRQRALEAATADKATRGQGQDAGGCGVPWFGHSRMVLGPGNGARARPVTPLGMSVPPPNIGTVLVIFGRIPGVTVFTHQGRGPMPGSRRRTARGSSTRTWSRISRLELYLTSRTTSYTPPSLDRRPTAVRRYGPMTWSGWGDLNSRPLRPERSALPSCATPRPRGTLAAPRETWIV